ncbi:MULTISPECIES: hypothetical protein [Microcoleaceae]|nr:hypothetical protein [Tychonema sp. LEGE 06208]MBE9165744.1 hypothetical protein [Tychonema sp. LEGE 06208]
MGFRLDIPGRIYAKKTGFLPNLRGCDRFLQLSAFIGLKSAVFVSIP